MREIRTSGSEGGGDRRVSPYPYRRVPSMLDSSEVKVFYST
jgi:hypothetical protein